MLRHQQQSLGVCETCVNYLELQTEVIRLVASRLGTHFKLIFVRLLTGVSLDHQCMTHGESP